MCVGGLGVASGVALPDTRLGGLGRSSLAACAWEEGQGGCEDGGRGVLSHEGAGAA